MKSKEKKYDYVEYNRSEGFVEIIIRDSTSAREATFKCNRLDFEEQKRIGKLLRDKYGLEFSPEIQDKEYYAQSLFDV